MAKKSDGTQTKNGSKVMFEEIEGRPQVVIVGNGIDRFVGGEDWNGLIVRGFDNFSTDDEDVLGKLPLPTRFEAYAWRESMKKVKDRLSTVLTDINNSLCHNYDANPRGKHLLKQLLQLDTDAIITTNFTKSLEFCCDNVSDFKKSLKELKVREAVCNNIYSFKETLMGSKKQRLYYAHGIMDNIESVIFSQSSYDQQLYETLESHNFFEPKRFSKEVKNEILTAEENNILGEKVIREENFRGYICNWVDLFRVADIYILGLGLDFAEIDIWALIKRWNEIRKDHSDMCGTITYYSPTERNTKGNRDNYLSYVAKKLVLRNNGVNIENCGKSKPETAEGWGDFYEAAIKHIAERIAERKPNCPTHGETPVVCKFVLDNN